MLSADTDETAGTLPSVRMCLDDHKYPRLNT